jgi:hypothetical protein
VTQRDILRAVVRRGGSLQLCRLQRRLSEASGAMPRIEAKRSLTTQSPFDPLGFDTPYGLLNRRWTVGAGRPGQRCLAVTALQRRLSEASETIALVRLY